MNLLSLPWSDFSDSISLLKYNFDLYFRRSKIHLEKEKNRTIFWSNFSIRPLVTTFFNELSAGRYFVLNIFKICLLKLYLQKYFYLLTPQTCLSFLIMDSLLWKPELYPKGKHTQLLKSRQKEMHLVQMAKLPN